MVATATGRASYDVGGRSRARRQAEARFTRAKLVEPAQLSRSVVNQQSLVARDAVRGLQKGLCMLEITDRACSELSRLQRDNLAGPHQVVRVRARDGKLAMTIDTPHPGDSLFRREHALVLIVEKGLSASLAQRVLDFAGPADRRSRGGFTLYPWTSNPHGNE